MRDATPVIDTDTRWSPLVEIASSNVQKTDATHGRWSPAQRGPAAATR